MLLVSRNHAAGKWPNFKQKAPKLSNPYEDYQRTGLDKVLKLGKTICRIMQVFEIIIRAKFPDSIAINALLAAIATMCSLLPEVETEFRAYALDQTPPPADALDTSGIDESAPPASPPDLT